MWVDSVLRMEAGFLILFSNTSVASVPYVVLSSNGNNDNVAKLDNVLPSGDYNSTVQIYVSIATWHPTVCVCKTFCCLTL